MSSTMKKCRVCGKEYEACRSANRGDSVFRWREVACSPECGAIYLNQINESRNHTTHKRGKQKVMVEPVVIPAEPVTEAHDDEPTVQENESLIEE